TEPRIPGQDATSSQPATPGKTKGTRAASVSVVATGRFVYIDDQAVRHGVRNATVELWNQNPLPSFGDELCARGITDADGNYTLGGSCGDLFDGPDLFVRIVLNNSSVEVKPDNIFAGSYIENTAVRQNSAGGAVNFGTHVISTIPKAFQAHN